MASTCGEPVANWQAPSPASSSSNTNNSDAGDFECNICLDLAQDPIVTLCGHLFCWPCLYKWLHTSHSQECPVCKALVEEEKLVPLYGRGKIPSDPRSRPFPGMDIPHRPMGQRPETAPPLDPNANPFAQQGFGVMRGFGPFGGFAPAPPARSGNFALSAALGGLFPSFFNIQVQGFPQASMYGPGHGYPHSHGHYMFHGGHARGFYRRGNQQQQADFALKILLLVIGLSVLMTLIWG